MAVQQKDLGSVWVMMFFGDLEDQDLEILQATTKTIVDRLVKNEKEAVVIIANTLDLKAITTAEQRKRIADNMAENPDLGIRLQTVVLINSRVLRGVMKAVSWVTPSVMKNFFPVATQEEAFELTKRLLEEQNQELPLLFRPSDLTL